MGQETLQVSQIGQLVQQGVGEEGTKLWGNPREVSVDHVLARGLEIREGL